MPEISIPNFEDVSVGTLRLDPGVYVVNVQDKPEIKENRNGKPYLELNMTVVDGPEQSAPDGTGSTSPVGRNIRDNLYLVDGAYFRIKQVLVAAGILARDDNTSPIARGQFNSDILVGTRFTVRLEAQMNNGKQYNNVVYVIS